METNADPLDQTIAAAQQKLEEKTKGEAKPDAPAPAAEGAQPDSASPAPAEGIPVEMTEEAIGDLYSTAFGLAASRMGDHWELQEYERANLSKATKIVLDKYAVKVSPEAMLVFWLGMSIAPRLYINATMKKAPAPASPIPVVPPAPEPKKKEEKPVVKEKTGWSADDKD